jgi:uncharacterized protein
LTKQKQISVEANLARIPMKQQGCSVAADANQGSNFPTPGECLGLMDRYGMLPHIREHSLLVAAVALRLGQALTEAGLALHLPLIEAGALLHDLGKTPCLGTMENHAEWGARAVAAAGYPEVAQIVREHVVLFEDPVGARPLREAEVVNYADKRVLHTEVVTLAARFADLKERYGKTAGALARIRANELRSQSLEQKIFGHLAWTPEHLLHLNHDRRKP